MPENLPIADSIKLLEEKGNTKSLKPKKQK
jgi:hypothetical protein